MDANGKTGHGIVGRTIVLVIAALLGIVVVAVIAILIALSRMPCGTLGGGCGPGNMKVQHPQAGQYG